MPENKGLAFNLVKYSVISLWVIHIIGCIYLLVLGSLVISATHIPEDQEQHEHFKFVEADREAHRFRSLPHIYTIFMIVIKAYFI